MIRTAPTPAPSMRHPAPSPAVTYASPWRAAIGTPAARNHPKNCSTGAGSAPAPRYGPAPSIARVSTARRAGASALGAAARLCRQPQRHSRATQRQAQRRRDGGAVADAPDEQQQRARALGRDRRRGSDPLEGRGRRGRLVDDQRRDQLELAGADAVHAGGATAGAAGARGRALGAQAAASLAAAPCRRVRRTTG